VPSIRTRPGAPHDLRRSVTGNGDSFKTVRWRRR
jgi:hypothetical protein